MTLIIHHNDKQIIFENVDVGNNKYAGDIYIKGTSLAPIDEEMIHSVNEFANTYVTEARLEQGLFYLENELELEADIKNTGKFISWVVNDIMKEEHDSIIANNINVKKLSGAIGNLARQWYIRKI